MINANLNTPVFAHVLESHIWIDTALFYAIRDLVISFEQYLDLEMYIIHVFQKVSFSTSHKKFSHPSFFLAH